MLWKESINSIIHIFCFLCSSSSFLLLCFFSLYISLALCFSAVGNGMTMMIRRPKWAQSFGSFAKVKTCTHTAHTHANNTRTVNKVKPRVPFFQKHKYVLLYHKIQTFFASVYMCIPSGRLDLKPKRKVPWTFFFVFYQK